MAELSLPQETCLSLRAQAHRLDPVVLLGAAGLSEAALREIDRALNAHGLVKVRAGKLDRDEREVLFGLMADRLSAARVQVIGHTFVLFRPIPEHPTPPLAKSGPARKSRDASTGHQPTRGSAKSTNGMTRSNKPPAVAKSPRSGARRAR